MAVLLAAVHAGLLAHGATFYVSKTGLDTNAGTQAAPWATIQKAADVMNPGDTVIVQEGTYTDRVRTKRAGKPDMPITFKTSGNVFNNGFQFDHSDIVVDGFQITGAPCAAYQGAMMVMKLANDITIQNCKMVNLTTNIYPVLFKAGGLLPEESPKSCVISNNVFKNCMANMVNLFGMNHLVVSNIFDTSNRQDALRMFGSGTRVTGNYFTQIGGGIQLPGHPDVLQIFGDNGYASYNHLFDNNLIYDCPSQLMMTSQDGVVDIRDVTFFNNTFIRVRLQANCSIPGLRWINNTFYKSAYDTGLVLTFGISKRTENGVEVIKGRADRARVFNNVFFMCSNDPSSINYGYYSHDTEIEDFQADYNFVCGSNYSPKRGGTEQSAFVFAEPHGINGGNPMFMDESKLDLRLADNSPLKGKGIAVPGLHSGTGPVDIGSNMHVGLAIPGNNPAPRPPRNLRVGP
jgi:hypothetical protein